MHRALLVSALVLALAACSSGPRAPLMSAIEGNGSYGFSDRAVDGNRVAVTYTGPSRQGFGYVGRNSEVERAAVAQAYDFALWRAAQLAQARGVKGFTVADSRVDVRTYNEPGYYDGGPYSSVGVGTGTFGTGIGLGVDSRLGPSSTSGYSGVKVTVNLTVDLRNDAAGKFYVADDVIAQTRRTYPDAESPRS